MSDLISRVLADPPQVHPTSSRGVYRADVDCYRFLETVAPGASTLETGCGISTVLFAAWSARHRCVVAAQSEVDAVTQYIDDKNLHTADLYWSVGPSDVMLPVMELAPVDVYLIDGCHGFPFPAIDWYYGARWLKPGGTLVVDDINLRPVSRSLSDFLDRDPRWPVVAQGKTWRAYRRDSAEPFAEDWTEQRFVR